jgi:hypothetical protein
MLWAYFALPVGPGLMYLPIVSKSPLTPYVLSGLKTRVRGQCSEQKNNDHVSQNTMSMTVVI